MDFAWPGSGNWPKIGLFRVPLATSQLPSIARVRDLQIPPQSNPHLGGGGEDDVSDRKRDKRAIIRAFCVRVRKSVASSWGNVRKNGEFLHAACLTGILSLKVVTGFQWRASIWSIVFAHFSWLTLVFSHLNSELTLKKWSFVAENGWSAD